MPLLSEHGSVYQVMPIMRDMVNITSSDTAPSGARVVMCVSDGTLRVNWTAAAYDDIPFEAGWHRTIPEGYYTLEVQSGTFDFA